MLIKNIETNRFILRIIKNTDEKDIYEMLSNPDIVENLNMAIHKNINDTKNMLNDYFEEFNKGNKYPFAIIEKSTNVLVGVFLIKLDLYDDDCFEFTVYIKKEYWNKGIYTEVLPYMTQFAFEKIKTKNFRGFVMEKNKSSCKVLEKCNFKLEKIFKVPNIEGNIISYLITKKDYESKFN